MHTWPFPVMVCLRVYTWPSGALCDATRFILVVWILCREKHSQADNCVSAVGRITRKPTVHVSLLSRVYTTIENLNHFPRAAPGRFAKPSWRRAETREQGII